jgi:hypothetical protein
VSYFLAQVVLGSLLLPAWQNLRMQLVGWDKRRDGPHRARYTIYLKIYTFLSAACKGHTYIILYTLLWRHCPSLSSQLLRLNASNILVLDHLGSILPIISYSSYSGREAANAQTVVRTHVCLASNFVSEHVLSCH